MSDGIGGVSGAGGAGGATAMPATDAAQGATPVAGAADTGDFNAGAGIGVESAGGSGGGGQMSNTQPPMLGQGSLQMSTQSFVSLQSQSVEQLGASQSGEDQSGESDLKKLVELLMAIKLLQEMDKQQG